MAAPRQRKKSPNFFDIVEAWLDEHPRFKSLTVDASMGSMVLYANQQEPYTKSVRRKRNEKSDYWWVATISNNSVWSRSVWFCKRHTTTLEPDNMSANCTCLECDIRIADPDIFSIIEKVIDDGLPPRWKKKLE